MTLRERDRERDNHDPRSWPSQLAGKSESLFRYLVSELTCDYGMEPGRAVKTLGVLIAFCSFPYMLGVHPRRFAHVVGLSALARSPSHPCVQ